MKTTYFLTGFCLVITACSNQSFDVLSGSLSVNDPSVSDETLCLSAFTSEVKQPRSKIQKNILDEIIKRGITSEQCASYVVTKAGGVDSFCSDLNHGYVNGDSSRMPSFGNYITLSDMFSVAKELQINCNTKQFSQNYFSPSSQRSREESMRIWSDVGRAWGGVLGSKF